MEDIFAWLAMNIVQSRYLGVETHVRQAIIWAKVLRSEKKFSSFMLKTGINLKRQSTFGCLFPH